MRSVAVEIWGVESRFLGTRFVSSTSRGQSPNLAPDTMMLGKEQEASRKGQERDSLTVIWRLQIICDIRIYRFKYTNLIAQSDLVAQLSQCVRCSVLALTVHREPLRCFAGMISLILFLYGPSANPLSRKYTSGPQCNENALVCY